MMSLYLIYKNKNIFRFVDNIIIYQFYNIQLLYYDLYIKARLLFFIPKLKPLYFYFISNVPSNN